MAKYLLLLLLILVLGTMLAAGAEEMAPAQITTIPGDSMNLTVVDHVNDYYVVVQVDPPVHNWFCGQFTNLPTDQICTLGLSMEGMDTPGNKADVKKWVGLRPVMTYADPTKYESYEWFKKDANGRWVSGDPFKQGDAKFAGMGKVPEQTAIPKDVAEQFLSEDGTYWQPWREIDSAEAVTGLNIFRMQQQFAYPTATVAMRVPYTYTYQQQYIERLQVAKLPGVFVDEAGVTPGGRNLQIVRVEARVDVAEPAQSRSLLVTAREHATEAASSWAVHGMLTSVLAGIPATTTHRGDNTWLFILIQDPDGSSDSVFDRCTNAFSTYDRDKPDAVNYARYIADHVNSGRTLDLAVAFHNIEANEGPNILSPFIDFRYHASVAVLNKLAFGNLREAGYEVGDPLKPWDVGLANARYCG